MSTDPADPAVRRATEQLRAGRPAEAEAIAQNVLQDHPDSAAALHCLGLIAQHTGGHERAIPLFSRAIELAPAVAEYRYNLAVSLHESDRLNEAETALRESLRLKPDLASARLRLGVLLFATNRADPAVQEFRIAAQLRPNDPRPLLNLGKALRALDRLDEAEAAFRRAIQLAPALAPAWNMLGSCLRESGRIADAIGGFETAVRLAPDFREASGNLCYALYFDPRSDPARILQEHRRWAARFSPPARERTPPPKRPAGRLRIGYVSPNFRNHVIGFFLEPIFANHDRASFKIVVFSDVTAEDALTLRLRRHADSWHDTAKLSDAQLAELVRAQEIDILVDLNLHMRGSRLGAFALRPATVQITYLAYCGTSGLDAMDACIVDRYLLTADNRELFIEQPLPLPESYWCYRPPPQAPPVGPPPIQRNGYVTFGSFNSLAKINDRVLATWAALLNRHPGSRLVAHIPGGDINRSILGRFAANGIPIDRLDPLPRVDVPTYLEQHSRADIALDPFPWSGGTTTFDALWMGVPVITLAGRLPTGRGGVSILTHLGLTEWIANSPEDYIERASSLAADPARLIQMRSELRGRLEGSILTDGARHTRNLEAAFRTAWNRAREFE